MSKKRPHNKQQGKPARKPYGNVPSWTRKDDPTYATQIHFFTPGQVNYMGRDTRAYVREGYRRVGVVYTCINKISNAAAGIKWKLYTDRTMRDEIEEHPLLDLWRHPNSKQGTAEFIENIFGFWHLSGNSYVWANRPSKDGPPGELWTLRPDWTHIVPGERDVAGYKYGPNIYTATPYGPEEVMHLKFPAYDEDLYGLSPIEVAATLIEQTNEGNRWNTALMQNFGKPSSAFFSKHLLTEAQREQISEEILDKFSGSENAGYPLIIESDMTWQQLSLTPAELDWLESRNVNKRDIAMIFDIAPELVGDTASKTFANAEQAEQHLYTDNVLPKLDKFSDHISVWLIPMFADLASSGAYFTYDRDDIEALAALIQTAKQQKSDRSNNNYKASKITLNEAREEDGYPPIDGGDRLLVGTSLIPLALLAEKVIISVAQTGVTVDLIDDVLAPPEPPPPQLALPAPGGQSPTTQVTEEPNQQTPQDGNTTSNDGGEGNQPADPSKTSSRGSKSAAEGTSSTALAVWEEKEDATQLPDVFLHPQAQAFQTALSHYFSDEGREVLRSAQNASTLTEARTSIHSVLGGHLPALKTLFAHHYSAIGNAEASQTALSLGGKQGRMRWEYKAAAPPSDDPMDMASYAAKRVAGIDASTQAEIQALFERAFAEGWSPYDLAPRLQNLYAGFTQGRAWTIARTEVMTASNLGRYVGARSLGLPVTKRWVATNDGKTRPAHREADGQEVELSASFDVGGDWMAFPGDSSRGASVDNIVCCRCTFSVALVSEKSRPSPENYRALLKGWN